MSMIYENNGKYFNISRFSKLLIHIQIASTDIIFLRILAEHKEMDRTMHRTKFKIGDNALNLL